MYNLHGSHSGTYQVLQIRRDDDYDLKAIISIIWRLWHRRRLPIMLLDYSCHLPDPNRRCTLDGFEYICLRSGRFNPESTAFMSSIFRKSGLCRETTTPPYHFQPPHCLSSKHPLFKRRRKAFSLPFPPSCPRPMCRLRKYLISLCPVACFHLPPHLLLCLSSDQIS
ncbi:3-ketoacyl-CoA synthase 11-like protein [Carex littledalei]|uniref:3-ketoacyl-CoA synthase 11-like protein n=1 Tax=Carex littledalei TaxID=544730 RepID=A0A833QYM6_9POAL|nr:3-ketoacyl-CoA synthase 11-like protein [Carex littledalei]